MPLARPCWSRSIRRYTRIRCSVLWGAVLSLAFVSPAHSQSQHSAAERVTVGTIIHNPPYVFENPSAGIDVDIIREAFAHSGIKVEIVHAYLSRMSVLLEAGRIDAMTAYRTVEDKCELSEPYGYWHNGIIARSGLNTKISGFEDLAGLKVGLFPQAKNIFGLDLVKASANFASETTVFTTPSALRMLSYDRLDVYVGDSWGLDYLFRQNAADDEVPPYEVAYAFEPTPRNLCFSVDKHRVAFNEGLTTLRRSGRIEKIIGRYRK